jgi:UPF0716 family protein affecting phage T7 exclusion
VIAALLLIAPDLAATIVGIVMLGVVVTRQVLMPRGLAQQPR